jgi:putative ABC transport system permease protein
MRGCRAWSTQDMQPVVPPPGGLVLSRDLADKLRIEAGGVLEIDVTEGRRPVLSVPVAAVTTTLIGSGAHMRSRT